MVLDRIRKVRLIDDREHVVAAVGVIRDEALVLEEEDAVLRI
jgi:hypothetical protein